MAQAEWSAVDSYIADHLLGGDPALDAALAANAAAGLPAIDVSPVQGKMLHLLARGMGARRILEVGTLGGYSTIWLARALPKGGRVVTLELDPHHAEVARSNIMHAGLADKVEVRVGPAVQTLDAIIADGEEPFDFIFVDADKEGYPAYLRAAVRLSRPGTMIVFDNVVREGGILDPDHADPRVQGTRALFEAMAAEPRLSATAVQTVGAKKWDGLALAIVD
ncbi:putative methyltransferase [Sphingomonas changbaiensis NBRC 104936]|uniref:Putative methyltransferase n=1 Tax=Sphingomonas changbaiensis NBRC 104936 TaxID=1219043 RepID=A0A0E9MMI2_9SPHN|nr:O-methyltransferase [Sphingomonas changbaiensis]GAO38972.1 putative methyltransferase [Sphingomonas changbaiensis NBRC 104936]